MWENCEFIVCPSNPWDGCLSSLKALVCMYVMAASSETQEAAAHIPPQPFCMTKYVTVHSLLPGFKIISQTSFGSSDEEAWKAGLRRIAQTWWLSVWLIHWNILQIRAEEGCLALWKFSPEGEPHSGRSRLLTCSVTVSARHEMRFLHVWFYLLVSHCLFQVAIHEWLY